MSTAIRMSDALVCKSPRDHLAPATAKCARCGSPVCDECAAPTLYPSLAVCRYGCPPDHCTGDREGLPPGAPCDDEDCAYCDSLPEPVLTEDDGDEEVEEP